MESQTASANFRLESDARCSGGDDVSQCMRSHRRFDTTTPVKGAEQDAKQRIANDDIRNDRSSERYSHRHCSGQMADPEQHGSQHNGAEHESRFWGAAFALPHTPGYPYHGRHQPPAHQHFFRYSAIEYFRDDGNFDRMGRIGYFGRRDGRREHELDTGHSSRDCGRNALAAQREPWAAPSQRSFDHWRPQPEWLAQRDALPTPHTRQWPGRPARPRPPAHTATANSTPLCTMLAVSATLSGTCWRAFVSNCGSIVNTTTTTPLMANSHRDAPSRSLGLFNIFFPN